MNCGGRINSRQPDVPFDVASDALLPAI